MLNRPEMAALPLACKKCWVKLAIYACATCGLAAPAYANSRNDMARRENAGPIITVTASRADVLGEAAIARIHVSR